MNYLKSINIKNYKCFKNISFSLKDINILIGENNAGKSTVIEAIKLIAFGIDRANLGRFSECPEFMEEPLIYRCIVLNIDNLLIDIISAGYKYSKEPSTIIAYFDNNIKTKITIFENKVYFQIFKDKNCITNRRDFISLSIAPIFVMPHFNLLRDLESLIDEKRVKKDRFNYRSSLHFRNELFIYKDDIPLLNNFLAKTWNHLFIDLSYNIGDINILALVRESDFTAEIKDYGSGLQMWLQILWFLCKIDTTNSIVVLDEPDVYIHADLQRKLYYLVSDRFKQTIIATHSIEIINEANLSNILLVDKTQSRLKFCKDRNSLGIAMSALGSNQNFILTKLQKHNKCLFVEGDDLDYLDYLYKLCNENNANTLKDFACCQLNGKNNYKESFGAAKIFQADSEGIFKTYCILDKDYNKDFNNKIKEEAEMNGVILHILDKVEIENYIIVPRVLANAINKDEDFIKENIVKIAEDLKGPTFDRILKEKIDEYRRIKLNLDISTISKETREYINENWKDYDKIVSIVSGKELKSKIFEWIKKEFNIQLTDKIILSKMEKADIPYNLSQFLVEISK